MIPYMLLFCLLVIVVSYYDDSQAAGYARALSTGVGIGLSIGSML